MRIAIVALAFALSACGGGASIFNPLPPEPTPLPADGPIAYRCSDGTQLMVDLQDNQARVAIIGGPSMVLPNAGAAYYSNGRYGFRGGGRTAQWEVGRAAPLQCQGG
jgi:membrane-bound inhibitor of C-type lysozyme